MINEEKEIDGSRYPFIKAYTHFVKKPEREIVGREKETRLILAAFCRPELSNVLLLGEAGAGKGNLNSEYIATPEGYKRFGDLKIGDIIYDENGKEVEVIGVFPQGLKRVYDVVFSDGSIIPCNDEHIWNVRTLNAHDKGYNYQNLTLREILDRGLYKEKSNRVRYNWWVPVNKAVERQEIELPLDPYVLGVLIGDGCLRNIGKDLEISSNEESVIKEVSKRLNMEAYEKCKGNYSWKFLTNDTYKTKWLRQNDLSELDESLDVVFGQYSRNRRIPQKYFFGSIEQRKKLLQGLMDTDGCITSGDRLNASFSTKSKGLAYDVKELANSLGMRVSISEQYRKRSDDYEYEVYFRVAPEERRNLFYKSEVKLKRFDDNMKNRTRKFNKHYDDMPIVDVIDTGREEEMTCIMVNSPTHLYQVGKSYIVTHNTALLQSTSIKDSKRLYLEVDLSRMLTELNNQNEMAARLKTLFDEAEAFGKNEGKELVLFIDEFHQIVQLSPAGVEALKPLLADSGTRGIRVVVATTYEEFNQYVSSNQALVERLMRINIRQPDKNMTVQILRGMAERYGVIDQFPNDNMFELIYEYTQRYMPSNSQPRKSILVLDAMVGWFKSEGRIMDRKLLADVLYDTQGVDVAFKVDATKIKEELDKAVFSQDFATSAVAKRLQLCVADLNDKSKPQSSFLMTGSSGVGKTELSKTLAQLLFSDNRALTRMDMTEYALPESLERFRQELTQRVWARPNCIVLLDEIEKACAPVTRMLLQVLDDGRLSDRNGREVSFINAYIIMTTNAGSEIYRNIASYSSDDTGSGDQLREYDALIRRSITQTTGGNRFPPELLGRIDVVVPFQPLSEATVYKIVMKKLENLKEEVARKHNAILKYTPAVLDFIVKDNLSEDSDSGGARRAISTLESEVTTKVAQFINENPLINRIGVDIEGTMRNEDKNIRKSQAKVVVKGIR